jgi:endo-1,4-beta-xylanase
MKLNNIIFPLIAGSLLVTGCYDEKMDWHTPADHGAVVSSEIPLSLAEEIANYDYIKKYMAQYMPNVPLGLGIGAEKYLTDSAYASVANANFQMFTPGNAMKHASVVKNDGSLNLATVSEFLTKAAENNISVYGHNFIWHTQQNSTYLKSLITPTMTVTSDGDIANVLKNGDFETGDLSGWFGWGNGSTRACEAGVGVGGSHAAVLVNPKNASSYDAQFVQDLSAPLVVGKTYVIRFKAKASLGAGQIQFCVQQPSGIYPAEGYHDFSVGTDWTTCEYEFTVASHDALSRLCLNFGAVAATYYIDDVEFGLKIEDPMNNVLTGDNSDFEGGTRGSWGSWGNKSTGGVSAGGYNNSAYCMILTNPSNGNQWDAQCAYNFNDPLISGTTYIIQFWAKSDVDGSPLQFQVQNGKTNGSQEGYHTFTLSTSWVQYEYEYTCSKNDVNRILLNFGKNAANYYIDNIKFGVKKATTSAKSNSTMHRTSKVTYTFKTAAEKREALLGAMKTWIEGMAKACPEVKQWDVVNEPITDGSYLWRGVDEGSWSTDDSTPVENATDGLTLNWADGHWYWGYFIGKDYAAKAFQYARDAIGSDAKLYVNDYNLETSPDKLNALIDFVKYIDANGGKVDGIGTQMHLTYNAITRDQVDAMFKTLAATGKLVRISEFDVAMGTATPSLEQYQTQSDVYKMVIESYKANIPEAQRGGICIWGLSDAADEHTYWIPDDAPNIFDKVYARKIAYKGVCDAIAGQDIGASFSGDLWPNAYK